MKTSAKAVPTTIGLDIAKNVFQVHAVDAAGQVVLRRKLGADFIRNVRGVGYFVSADAAAPGESG